MGKRKGKGQEPFTKKQKIDQNVNATSNTGWKKRLDSPKGITIPTVPVVLSHSAVQSKSHFEKGNTKDNHSTAQKTIASTVPSSVPSSAPNAVPNTGQGSSKRKRNRKKKGKGAILSNTDGNLSMDQVKEVQVEPKEIKVIAESVKTPDEPSEPKEAQIEAQVMDAHIKKKKSKKKKKKQSEEKVEDVAIDTVAKDDGKVDKKKDKETVKFELEQTPETKVSTYTQYEAPPRPKFTKDDSDQVLRDYLNSQDLNPIVWVYINRLESHIRNLNEKVKTAMDETISLQEHWEKSKRLVTCQVCLELFTNPQVIECGHSFCYSCIKSWIEQNKDDNGSCPTCRNALTQKPQLNVGLEQFVHHIVEEMKEPGKSIQEKRLNDCKVGYKAIGELWPNWIEIEKQVMVDLDDGVERCVGCGWEIVDGSCVHCGALYSRPREELEVEELISEEEEPNSSDDEFVVEDDVVEFETRRSRRFARQERESRAARRSAQTRATRRQNRQSAEVILSSTDEEMDSLVEDPISESDNEISSTRDDISDSGSEIGRRNSRQIVIFSDSE